MIKRLVLLTCGLWPPLWEPRANPWTDSPPQRTRRPRASRCSSATPLRRGRHHDLRERCRLVDNGANPTYVIALPSTAMALPPNEPFFDLATTSYYVATS